MDRMTRRQMIGGGAGILAAGMMGHDQEAYADAPMAMMEGASPIGSHMDPPSLPTKTRDNLIKAVQERIVSFGMGGASENHRNAVVNNALSVASQMYAASWRHARRLIGHCGIKVTPANVLEMIDCLPALEQNTLTYIDQFLTREKEIHGLVGGEILKPLEQYPPAVADRMRETLLAHQRRQDESHPMHTKSYMGDGDPMG